MRWILQCFSFPGNDRCVGDIFSAIWSGWVWRKWSKSKALGEEWSPWHWRTSRSVAARIKILCDWSINGIILHLELHQIYTTEVKYSFINSRYLYGPSTSIMLKTSLNFPLVFTWNRLAGVALVVPVVNYRWPSFPDNLIKDDYRRKLVQSALWFADYAPGLLQWWVSQKWLPSTSVMERNPAFFNTKDIDVLKTIPGFPMLTKVSISWSSISNC